MKRLIPSAFIAAALLGSVGQVARAQTTMRDQGIYRQDYGDQGPYRQDYRYQGTYHRSYGNWGLLGLSGLLGLLGARRSRTHDRTYYESTRPMYESTGRAYDQTPLHQPT
jgi:hypothetical protein